MKSAIVMAAGKGTRMKSEKTKTMHQVFDKPMIEHVYDNLKKAGVDHIVVVVGHGAEQIQNYLKDKVEYAMQMPQLGTGHAVMQAECLKGETGKTIIFNGDCPLVQPETIEKLFEKAQDAQFTLLTTVLDDALKYGRIIRDEHDNVEKIVEFKDCNEEELQVKEINVGIYCVDNELLWKYLPELTNDNAQKEYYITDLVEIFKKHGHTVNAMVASDPDEMIGVNDRVMLEEATRWLKRHVNRQIMNQGVTLIDSEHTYLSTNTVIGEDSVIYPNVYMEGHVIVGKNCTILPGTYLKNVVIGDGCTIDSSRLTDTKVGNDVTIGPNSHLRNGCEIADKVRIGNFVELKNSKLGYNTKCAHLTYIGDSTVGEKVNFGCGVVTVNYDGKNKFRTEIGDGAFIGSNVNIIAPVKIGKNALLAAGSTINHDVEDGDMAIARPRQEVKKGFGDKYKNK